MGSVGFGSYSSFWLCLKGSLQSYWSSGENSTSFYIQMFPSFHPESLLTNPISFSQCQQPYLLMTKCGVSCWVLHEEDNFISLHAPSATRDMTQRGDLSSISWSSRRDSTESTKHLCLLALREMHWRVEIWMTKPLSALNIYFYFIFSFSNSSFLLSFGYHLKLWTKCVLILIIVKLEAIWQSFSQGHHHTEKQYIFPTIPIPTPITYYSLLFWLEI